MKTPQPFTRRSRKPRPKDIICRWHRRLLSMIGVGSLVDFAGRNTRDALARIRTEMSTCTVCQELEANYHLDSKDATA